MRILIAAGGSGGHLFPAQKLAELFPEAQIHFAGHRLADSPFFRREQFSFSSIESCSIDRPVSFLRTLWKSTPAALRPLRRWAPDVVVGFGSYHTIPVLLAAVILRKPIVLYEANASLGRVNGLFAPFARAVASPFPKLPCKQAVQIAFFPWIQEGFSPVEAQVRSREERPVCLVFGGSQGASFLNEHFWKIAQLAHLQVIHCTGSESTVAIVQEQYAKVGVPALVKAFESQMERVYAEVDCAVCRAGSGTVGELIHYRVPALLIPYPYAAGHQQKNAEFFAGIGGGRWLKQNDADPERCAQLLKDLLRRKEEARQSLRHFVEQNGATMRFEQLVGEIAEGTWDSII